MKRFLIYSLLLCFCTAGAQTIDHSKWTEILQFYVAENGNVNYKGLQKNRKSLNAYLNNLAQNAPEENWSKAEKMAYWINAYNAYTIQLILNNYPTESIKDIKDPWGQTFFEIGGKMISLNTIEHEILRPMGDPRIHFAIVCASESCPKLLNCAYEAKSLTDQLDQAAREFINDTSKNSISESKITISKIFKWFKSDFPKGDAFINYLNKYSTVKIFPDININYKTYNWSLNE
ncbi:DUF547 domain-containing protein [Flavobacteriaceae bacterium]|nr:DUF547 domain-containing protein [Flavobacteriaceae bacterium]MDB9954900.1 DUF547 domain-containing protein [Flavobacteriaceae bacterium]MDC1265579.1 DUF547 domain-containing protein [Flavobacteriaceae bacterium]